MKCVKTTKTNIVTKTYKHDTLPINIIETITNGKSTYSFKLNKKFKHNVRPILVLSSDKFWEHKETVTLKSLEDINNYILYLWDSAGDIWFDVNMNILATPFVFDYCGHFIREKESNDKDFEKIISWIKSNPIYSNIKIGEIAYYNSEFVGQKALLYATVFPSQEDYERIYNLTKDEEFYSVNIRDSFRFGYRMFDFNPFDADIMKMLKEFSEKEFDN